MNKKIFTATALAAFAGLAGVAIETRPAPASQSTTQAPPAPNVETVVIQRTEHVRKRIKQKRTASASAAAAAARRAAPVYRPIAVRTAPVAPRVKTSPSSTGARGDDGEEREGGDDGGERDD